MVMKAIHVGLMQTTSSGEKGSQKGGDDDDITYRTAHFEDRVFP
jgi:hypothetical protein